MSEHKSAFMVIKSAEGRRSKLYRPITEEKYNEQREAMAKDGIARIVPVRIK